MADDISVGQYYQSRALSDDAERFRNSMSANALVRQYGPAYANPQMAQQAATANETTLLTPGKVERQSLDNNFLAQSYPQQVQSQKTANVLSGQQATQGEVATREVQASERRRTLGALVTATEDAINEGRDPGQVFDSAAQSISQLSGGDPQAIAAYRERFIANPKAVIGELRQRIPAAEIGAMTPAQRVTLGTAGLDVAKKQAEIQGKNAANAKAYMENLGVKSAAEAAQHVAGLQSYQQRSNTMMAQIDDAIAAASKIKGNAVMRTLSSYKPGTPEYDFAQNIKQIGDNAGLADLQGMKQAGFSFGRVAVAEMTAAGHAFNNITPGSSKDRIISELTRLKKSFSVINGDINNNVDRAVKVKEQIDRFSETSIKPPTAVQAPDVRTMASPFSAPGVPQAQQGPPPGTPTGTGTFTMPGAGAPGQPIQNQAAGVTLPGGVTIPIQQYKSMNLNDKIKALLGNK